MAKRLMDVAKAEGLQVNEVISANIVLSCFVDIFNIFYLSGF